MTLEAEIIGMSEINQMTEPRKHKAEEFNSLIRRAIKIKEFFEF